MNHNHVHILCPYNFCSCICCECNYYLSCQCKCHKLNNKLTLNDIPFNNCNNINKTQLTNYSNDILYNKERFQNNERNYNNSPHIYNNKRNNKDIASKRLIQIKLNKDQDNNNKYKYSSCHSRSISELNYNTNIVEKINLPERNGYYNKSYMNNFYDHRNSYYNPSSERESMIARKRCNSNGNDKYYMNIRGDRSEEKIMRKKDEDFLNFDYPQTKTIDINKNNKDDINKKYLNNYNQKRNTDRSYINSVEKRDKSLDNIINRKRKDVYIQLDLNSNMKNHRYTRNNDNNDIDYKRNDYNNE